MGKKILFVSHAADRSGAPMVLFYLMQWLRNNTSYDLKIISLRDGELVSEFNKIGQTFVWDKNTPTGHIPLLKRVKRKIVKTIFKKTSYNKKNLSEISKWKPALIYVNTVVSHAILPELQLVCDCPVISHIHENEYSLKAEYASFLNHVFTDLISVYIAVSKSTKENLVRNFNIPANRVFQTYEFADLKKFRAPSKTKESIREELNIPENSFVVGGAGNFLWRKGVDLFQLLSVKVYELRPDLDIRFVWIGGGYDKAIEDQLKYERDRMGIHNLQYAGVKTDPENYFQVLQVFVLTSREDPFPLVCIENASMGNPIVCFENSGGIPEMLENGGGFTVPFSDITKMAEKIIELSLNKELYNKTSEEVYALSGNYDVNIIAPVISNLLQTILLNRNNKPGEYFDV